MKTQRWLGLIAAMALPFLSPAQPSPENQAPAATGAAPALSPGTAEVVRLAEAGTSEEVILAYIQNATTPFELSADQILYLRDIGVSAPVTTAMLSRDSVLRNHPQSSTYDQKLYPASAPPPSVPAPAQNEMPGPAPAPVAIEAPATPPEYVSTPPAEVSYFYNDLSPYGSWVQLDGVGWCWQPRVVAVNRAWRPYCDSGHWVYTDDGWFWQSEYSWGWAPFHYGRWHLHARCGWVWLPDRVWGPAWVTWRSEGDHCGWAPLPPHADFDLHVGYRFNGVHVGVGFDFGLRPEHFTFIALRDFNQRDFAHHRLPPTEVTRIYSHTTVINNYVVHKNTIVNQGIKVDRVNSATHSEFRKVAIRDVSTRSAAISGPRAGGRNELAVYRPQLKSPARPVNMVAQKVDDRHPVIQHAPVVAASVPRSGSSSGPGSNRGNFNRSTQPSGAASGRGPQERQVPGVARPSTTPTYSLPTQQPRRPTDSSSPSSTAQPGTSRNYYPLRAGPTSSPSQPSAQGQSSTTYQPKGYEPRSTPQVNARPAESRSPSVNTRPSGPSDSGNRVPRGPSKKNDQ